MNIPRAGTAKCPTCHADHANCPLEGDGHEFYYALDTEPRHDDACTRLDAIEWVNSHTDNDDLDREELERHHHGIGRRLVIRGRCWVSLTAHRRGISGHPDVGGDAAEFRAVQSAYEALRRG